MEEIVIWNKQPSIHDIGQILRLSARYQIFMVCDGPIRGSRVETARWSIADYGHIKVSFLTEKKNPRRFVGDVISRHETAIHLVTGWRGSRSAHWALGRLLRMKSPRIVLSMEAPNQRGGVKRILQSLHYRFVLRKCRGKVAALLGVGCMAAETYRRLGFPAKKIFPTMYGYASDYPPLAEPTLSPPPLRLIYVGQAVPAKGILLLLEAVARFPKDRVHLQFVGSDRMSLVADAMADPRWEGRVSSLGVVPNRRIPSVIAEHDILFLPSLNDGWGMVTTEAIIAGIGAVVTDACGSQDLVRSFDAGRIVKANSLSALTEVIADSLDHPERVLRWKQNARSFRDLTRPEVIADYSEKVFDYVFKNDFEGPRPLAPWLDVSNGADGTP